jgi:hypothetical protein
MIIKMMETIIDRYYMPSNSDFDNHIKNIHTKEIGKFITKIIPQIGEIIKYQSINYQVIKVIRNVVSIESEEFYIEVKKYSTEQSYSYGSRSWRENIPLCIDIKEK